MLACLIIVATGCIHWAAFRQRQIVGGLNLTENWNICFENTSKKLGILCEPLRGTFPDPRQANYQDKVFASVDYRNIFLTPSHCVVDHSNGCVLFLGGVYQGAEVFLNGKSLGQHFSNSDLYPATFSIPKSLLKADGVLNDLRLLVYTTSFAQRPAVTQGPIGIFRTEDSHSASQKIIGERIVLPIVCAAVNITLALVGLFWLLSKYSSDKVIKIYVYFCLVAAAYMLSATRLPREILGYNLGMSLHYTLRYLMDFLIFLLTITFFPVTSRLLSILKFSYFFVIGTFFTLFMSVLTFPEEVEALTKLRFNFLSAGRFRQDDIIYIIAFTFTPLLLLGKIPGLVLSTRFFKRVPGSTVLLLLFLVIVPMQFLDILTFLGVIRVNHEIYYMRLYTPYIGLSFGYVIWLAWIEKERRAESTFRVGEIAKSVAHDLRSPLSVLRILAGTDSIKGEEEKELLSNAIARIDGISSNVLIYYHSDQINSFTGAALVERTFIREAVLEVVKTRNYFLADIGRPKITVKSLIKSDVFCEITKSDFCRSLDNVLSNAIDAILENDSLSTGEHSIWVSLEQKNDMVEITVTDLGKEVEEILVRQLNSKDFGRTTKKTGNGIGLSEVWRVVQILKGTLHFEKRLEGGMLVRIVFPVTSSRPNA